MARKQNILLQGSSPYNGGLTREQFLFYEMRITAKLLLTGLSDEEIIKQIMDENLFQYPTEKSVRNLSGVCLKRLHALNDESLVRAIAVQSSETAKQICLYAMMKQNRLVWDFMVTVIGEKFRMRDTSFNRVDLNAFFIRLQEQDDKVAAWSEATIKKIMSVLVGTLIETGYLDNNRAKRINPVLIDSILENGIRNNGDEVVLPVFNCFD